MPLSTFEKLLPWSGVVAGLAWIAQDTLARVHTSEVPGRGSVTEINDHLGLNTGSLSCLVIMGVALLFFATAVRNLLRSGEAREATYSSVAYGGWIVVAAGLAQMAVWTKGLMSAAEDGDEAATQILSYAQYFGWLGMGVGIAAAFLAIGLGGHAQRGAAPVVRDHHPRDGCARAARRLQHPAGRPGQLPAAAVLADRRLHHHRSPAEGRERRQPAGTVTIAHDVASAS